MIEITDAQISSWINHYVWPLYRILAFFLIAPLFGARNVPQRVRILLGVTVTFLLAPMLPPMPDIEAVSLASTVVVAHQLVIGVALGFLVMTLFQVFVLAGQAIAMQMGLGYASMMDPANGISVTVLAQWYLTLVTLLFLAINGHLVVFEVLIESFYTMPVGQTGLMTESFYDLTLWGRWMFASAVSIALPAIGSLLLVNIAFGIMNRAAPSMNIFSLGFPMTMLMGLFVLWLSFNGVLATIHTAMAGLTDMMKTLVNIPL